MADDKQKLIDYNETFNSVHGKRVLKDIMRIANFNYAVVPKDSTGKIDVSEVLRREGQRSVIIHIIRQMEKKG
jgi:hypothetical protein